MVALAASFDSVVEKGFVRVDSHLRLDGFTNVFAAGDIVKHKVRWRHCEAQGETAPAGVPPAGEASSLPLKLRV